MDSFEILRHSYPKVLHSDEIPTSATPSKLSMGLPESYTEKYYKLPSYMRLPQRILQSAETKSKNSKTSSEDSNISESTINEFDSESHVKIVVIK